jgi:hypothetical protein
MKRLLTCALLPIFILVVHTSPAADKEKVDYREKLQPFNDFIGQWKGDGKEKSKTFTEDIEWGWKFKGDQAWLVLKIKDGKQFKSGELHYMPDKKNYQMTMTDINDKKLVFEGEMKKNYLTLEREDADNKERQQIVMFNAGDGVFLNYQFKKATGKKAFTTAFEVKAKREGVDFGPNAKKNECVVSGGLGTSAVTYKGQTYYICCSGCRDAFNENPEKYVKEFEAKKKK